MGDSDPVAKSIFHACYSLALLVPHGDLADWWVSSTYPTLLVAGITDCAELHSEPPNLHVSIWSLHISFKLCH